MGWLDWLTGSGSGGDTVKADPADAILREQQLWLGASTDPDLNLSATQGGSLYFNKLSQSNRELSPLQQQRSQELAYYLFESNPMAKAVVEIPRDFVLGDSVNVTSVDPDKTGRADQQDIIDGFWNDPINLMDIKLQTKVMELGLFGEQCWPVEVNPVDGHVQLGYIDPGNIKDILVDPWNVERQLAVIVAVRTESGQPDEHWYKIISQEADPNAKWFGRQTYVPDGGRITWRGIDGKQHSHAVQGSCFFWPINKVTNAKRGRTDLLSLVDWIDAYDQMLFGEVDRNLLMKAFIWDVSLEGYSDKQIDDYRKANPQPKPASVRYHNNKVSWTAVTPDLKATDATHSADLIASYVATGARLPKTWINGLMDVNRASAKEMSAPAVARLTMRQKLVKYIILQVVTFALDQAEMVGRLPKRSNKKGTNRPDDWSLNVTLPNLDQKEKSTLADMLVKIVTAVTAAKAEGLIDAELGQELIGMIVTDMGIEVDLQALKERIAAAKAEEAAAMAAITPPVAGVPPAPASGGGGGSAAPVVLNGKTFDANQNPESVLAQA